MEVLLQTWHRIDEEFAGQSQAMRDRLKTDFALSHVFGIEIHEILARICKINLLLHHDGHTNIEADRSCLDSTFINPRLNNPTVGFFRPDHAFRKSGAQNKTSVLFFRKFTAAEQRAFDRAYDDVHEELLKWIPFDTKNFGKRLIRSCQNVLAGTPTPKTRGLKRNAH